MQTPAYVVSRLPAAFRSPVRPAGQAQLSSTPIGVTTGNEPGNPAQGLNIFGYDDQGRPLDAQGGVLPSTVPGAVGGGGGGISAGDQALYNTVASGLNTTGATIASVVQSNNQAQIASLQSQTQQQIASLQAAATQAQQQGNLALAQQQSAQAAQMQRFNALLLSRMQQPNTALYVVAGLAGLAIIGGIVYFATSRRSEARDNPSHSRHRRFHSYRRYARYHGAA